MELSKHIDNNWHVSIDGMLQPLRPLVAQLEAENERLREAIEDTLAHRGPDWASILRYALIGE